MSCKNKQIYFIQADSGLVKIGVSKKVSKRLKSLQSCSPVILKIKHTIPGNLLLEHILHVYFAHIRKHGEWFKPNYELKEFLLHRRKISIASIYDVVVDKISRNHKNYLERLEDRRLYL